MNQEGSPVAEALVEIPEVGRKALTGADGEFRFEELPAGSMTVKGSAAGHYHSSPLPVLFADRQEFRVEVTLVPMLPVTQSVVVTGTGTEHLIVDAPVRTSVVSGALCERTASRSLADALTSTVVGVRVESNCQACAPLSVRMNGLEGKYTQVLEDGLPTMSNVSMVYALDQIPTDFFDSVEVVKGGGSALYGPNAVGGVINLVRREPRAQSARVDMQTGWTSGRPEQSVGLTGQSSRLPAGFSGDVYVRSMRRASIDLNDDGFSDLPKRRLTGGGSTLYRRFLDGSARLVLGGSHYADFRRGGDNLHLPPHRTYLTEMADASRSTAFVRWNHTVNAATFYTLASSYSNLRRDTYYGADFDPNAYGQTRNPLVATDAQAGHQHGSHTLLGGVQFQREKVTDRIPSYGRRFDELFRNVGFYAQDEIRLTSDVILVAGVRADKSNVLPHWIYSPRGGVRVGLTDAWRLRFSVSTGFRAPVIFDEDLHVAAVGGTGLLIENAPGLKEERSLSWTGSIDYAGITGARPLQIGVTFFHTALSNVHLLDEVLSEGSDFRKLIRINGAGSYVQGAEVDFNWQLHPRLLWRGGATWQAARYREAEPQFGSRRYFRSPSVYGFVGADLKLPRGFSAVSMLDMTGGMLIPHYAGYIAEDRLETSKSFKVVSLVLDRAFASGPDSRYRKRLYVKMNNLLNQYQPDLDRGPLRDSGYVYGPLAAGVSWPGFPWISASQAFAGIPLNRDRQRHTAAPQNRLYLLPRKPRSVVFHDDFIARFRDPDSAYAVHGMCRRRALYLPLMKLPRETEMQVDLGHTEITIASRTRTRGRPMFSCRRTQRLRTNCVDMAPELQAPELHRQSIEDMLMYTKQACASQGDVWHVSGMPHDF